jgi:hypothetical protein
MTEINLNGLPVKRIHRSIFIPLPRELWRPCGGCCCEYCSADGSENPDSAWDTLAVSTDPKNWHTWTTHAPEYHGIKRKRSAWKPATSPAGVTHYRREGS